MKTKKLHELMEQWLNSLELEELSTNTINQYKNNLNQLLKYLKEKNLEEVSKKDFMRFKQDLLEAGNLKINTINMRIISLNKFLKDNGLKDMTIKQVKTQKINDFKEAISEKDYKALLKYTKFNKNDGKNYRDYLLMRTLGETGVRVSELKFFTVEALKNMDGNLTVYNKGKYRDVFLTQELKQDLLDYAKDNNIKNIIFHGKDPNKMLNRSVIYLNLKKLADKVGIDPENVHPHAFRHRYALKYLEIHNNENQALMNLAKILGHSKLDTTRVYLNVTDKELEESVKGIGAGI